MGTEPLERRLAAILYADVAGYSRLTGEDEDATHRTLSAYLDLISRTVADHRGRVVHYAGDAVLAKFNAVVNALSSAVAIQKELATRNQNLPDSRRVQFRIGVNLGDVIEDRGDIYGDGVNVAARLESLAEPGGICISDAVRAAVGKKLDLDYEDLGAQEVKNIEDPVRAYRVAMGDKETPEVRTPGQPSLELPDKPSIAVLPFTNVSGDPDQDYFSDGISEDIITELSRLPELFVTARNRSFAFRDKPIDIVEVGAKLGVGFVVEGSVRKAGKRVRVTAQLVDAATGNHIWVERYDRELEDVFAVQDDLCRTIVSTLAGRLRVATQKISAFKVLTFDCYGTLIDWESGILDALTPLAKRAGLSDMTPDALTEKVLEEFAAHEAAQQKETPSMRYADLLAVVYKKLATHWGITISDAEAVKFGKSIRTWLPFPDTVDALTYLNRHYKKLVILSNVDRDSFAASNKLLKVRFGEIYTAEDIGSYKPDLRNFEYLLRQLEAQGFLKSDILHVAQSKFHDHMPATEIGLATAWIDRRPLLCHPSPLGHPPKDARINVDFYFRSLNEFVERHKVEKKYAEDE
ncbi:MAG: haloacid dehalogenase type II, partial [Acidiferrobacterales bacterium]|nr:haloacid dehalogenase type II [Acidiferrobacterales bacterium]